MDVVARRAQHCVKPIANFALEVTVIHALIALEVTDDDLNRLAPLEQRSFSLADLFTFPPLQDAHIRVVRIHPSAGYGQVALERAGTVHLHPKLVRLLGLARADALHCRDVPRVELGSSIGCLALAALVHDARDRRALRASRK